MNFEKLKQELSSELLDDSKERYEFTWPDKRKAILNAITPTNKTLRPNREESKDFDTTQNLYIEGDNLEVLKLLQKTYLGKVKMIYIDPPYNTGNDFIYKDNFKQSQDEYNEQSSDYDDDGNRLVSNPSSNGRFHTDWLNMIYPRLKLARDLLTDDGVIFISIDDNEQANLKKVCDEIFGEGNFVGELSVENNPKGRKNSDYISVSSEYCLIYAQNKSKSYFIENIPKNANDMVLDENGKYVHNSGKRVLVGENSFNSFVKNVNSDKNYSVYYKKKDNLIKLKIEKIYEKDNSLINAGYKKYYSYFNGKLVENTYTRERFIELFNNDALSFSDEKIYEKNYSDTIRIKSQLVNKEYEAIVNGKKKIFSFELTTTGAGTYLKKLFNMVNTPFEAPKNVGFLKILLTLLDDKNFLAVDFFSGAASFADAVMKLNAEDGGNRKFIMVQLPEVCAETSEAYKAGYKNICEIGKERIRRAGQKIKDESPLTTQNLDVGFRVLKVDSSNMKDVFYKPSEVTGDIFDNAINNIKEDRTGEDLLFQVLLDMGISLSSKIEKKKIKNKEVFYVYAEDEKFLIASFDRTLNDDVVTEIAKEKPQYFVMRDTDDDKVRINFEQIFKAYSPDTTRKVL